MQSEGTEKKRLKICFVVTKGVWGGAQKYVFSLATSLPKDSYEPLVIVGEGEALPEKLESAGIKTIRIKKLERDISIKSELKSFFELWKIVRKEKPDVLHLNSSKAGGIGALVGRLSFVPKIIFTAHGWIFNEDRPPVSNVILTFLSWITVLLSHKIIVINSREEAQAKVMPFASHKVVLIRNGIEKINFKDKGDARKEIIGKSQITPQANAIWFGTLSELHKNKGLEYAITALSKIDSPFVFFVLGEGEERKKLEDLIEMLNLQNKVILLGFVEHGNELLKAFDIFLLPSIKEGLPYVILEAGLAALPVIASSVGGIPNIIRSDENGILTTKTRSGEIQRAIEYMINNPKKQKIFGDNLKKKIEKDFSIEHMIEETQKLYSN